MIGERGNSTQCPLYPSYVDLDVFVEVDRLKALDGFISSKIERHIREEKASYFLNQHRLDEASPYQPGVREIWLSETVPGTPYDYLDLDRTDLWRPSAAAVEFEPVMRFIETLPFSATGRILLIFDGSGKEVPAHRDHLEPEVCNEFIWFRTNLEKRLYMMNGETGQKVYVTSYSAWFDTVNQFHGAEASNGLSFSIRVDGVFRQDFRAQIPFPAVGKASAPALWARAGSCTSLQGPHPATLPEKTRQHT